MNLRKLLWFEIVFSLAFGIWASWLTFKTGSWLFAILAVLGLGAGVLYIKRNGWAHIASAGIFAFIILALTLPGVITHGITLRRIIVILACSWACWSHVASWKALKQLSERANAMTSMVLLRDQPSAMDARGFKAVVKRAWGIDAEITENDQQEINVEGKEGESAHFIIGDPPHILLFSNFKLWALHMMPTPYWEDPQSVAEDCQDLGMAKAIRDHKALVSFDCIGDHEEPREHAYDQLAKVIAECVDDHTLGVFIPEEGRFIAANDELTAQLKSWIPSSNTLVSAEPPIINMDGSDEALPQAVETAKRRWPEFKQAFSQRDESQSFTVKAPITVSDHTEFLWINVSEIENGMITGTLGNKPVALGSLTIGSRVTIPEENVNDWVFSRGDELVGLFSANAFPPNDSRGNQ